MHIYVNVISKPRPELLYVHIERNAHNHKARIHTTREGPSPLSMPQSTPQGRDPTLNLDHI